jgi:hypothetical protein
MAGQLVHLVARLDVGFGPATRMPGNGEETARAPKRGSTVTHPRLSCRKTDGRVSSVRGRL